MANKIYEKMVDEYNKRKKRFIGYYSGYATSLVGDNIVDAIKDFYGHYNAILSAVADFEKDILYIGKENDKPDIRGYYNYHYYNANTNEIVYNRDDATRPLDIVKPSKINKESHHGYIDRNGKFYECGFEEHRWLADELFITNTVQEAKNNESHDNENVLEERGWVKISSKRIHFLNIKENGKHMNLTKAQKKTISRWMDIIGDENYEYKHWMKSKNDILLEMYEKD